MEIFFALMEIFKCALASRSPPPQPRPSTNDIAVVLLLASGRHQWPHNQLFASTAITYQLAEWLSRLSIGPSGLSCLSVLPATRRCPANKNSPRSIWGSQSHTVHSHTGQDKPSKKIWILGRGWHCLEPPCILLELSTLLDTDEVDS